MGDGGQRHRVGPPQEYRPAAPDHLPDRSRGRHPDHSRPGARLQTRAKLPPRRPPKRIRSATSISATSWASARGASASCSPAALVDEFRYNDQGERGDPDQAVRAEGGNPRASMPRWVRQVKRRGTNLVTRHPRPTTPAPGARANQTDAPSACRRLDLQPWGTVARGLDPGAEDLSRGFGWPGHRPGHR